MTDKDRIVFRKLERYIQEIFIFTRGLSFEEFMNDRKTITATAFDIGQIGELVNEISEETKAKNMGIPWASIRGMRNKIIHDYENVDLAVLWGTIMHSLPKLLREINIICNPNGNP